MRLVFTPRMKGRIDFGLLYGGIALIILASARFLPLLSLLPECAFRRLTGFPCPTCGATHALVYLAQGEALAAFSSNPLVASAAMVAVFAFLSGLAALVFRFPRAAVAASEKEQGLIRAAAAVLFLIHWFYLMISA